MHIDKSLQVPIIKGINECFFADDDTGECQHVNRIYERCPGTTCRLHRPAVPLKKPY